MTVASSNPASGVSITVSPNDNSSQGNGTTQFTRTYNNNTVVSLTALATASGNNFQKWLKDGADFANNNVLNVSVTMDANHTIAGYVDCVIISGTSSRHVGMFRASTLHETSVASNVASAPLFHRWSIRAPLEAGSSRHTPN